MTSTINKSIFLALVLFAFLLFRRPNVRPSPSLDTVLVDLVSHAVSRAQELTGIVHPAQLAWNSPPTALQDRNISQPDSLAMKLCGLLSGKKLLFVGPETTYHLHSVWLSTLEALENRSHPCLGRDYCTFHHICQPPLKDLGVSAEPLPRKKKMPGRQLLLSDNSSLILYSFSSTLYASPDKHDPAYTHPQVDPYTQVRQSNTFWRRQARKSDIVLMNRPPLPAPASTYPNGNWSFAQSLCMDVNYLAPVACHDTLEKTLMNAAIHTTIKHFLPSLLDTLRAVSLDSDMKKALLVWHSSWYIQPFCAISALPNSVPLLRDIFSSKKRSELTDPWSYYYNAQVYIHHRLLPDILPYFNVAYLSLERLDQSGPSYLRFLQDNKGATVSRRKDCIRNPWPNFSADVQGRIFFEEMIRVLEVTS